MDWFNRGAGTFKRLAIIIALALIALFIAMVVAG